jgi:hypothetical protein
MLGKYLPTLRLIQPEEPIETPNADLAVRVLACVPSIVQHLGGESPLHILMEEK